MFNFRSLKSSIEARLDTAEMLPVIANFRVMV